MMTDDSDVREAEVELFNQLTLLVKKLILLADLGIESAKQAIEESKNKD